ALQLAILLACGLPVLAVIQPFVPAIPSIGVLLAGAALLAWAFWRSVAHLDGHVRAGAQVAAEVLSRQTRAHEQPDLRVVGALLPGLGRLTPVEIGDGAAAVGRSLRELDLHARTNATIVCIARARAVVAPNDDQRVAAGDWIVLTGTDAAVESARSAVEHGVPDRPTSA